MSTEELRRAVESWLRENEPGAKTVSLVVGYGGDAPRSLYQLRVDESPTVAATASDPDAPGR
jgi:hypothetical protein